MPVELPDRLQVKLRDPIGVQVEPGGETHVKPDGGAAHGGVGAMADGMAEEVHGDMQDEAERLTMC